MNAETPSICTDDLPRACNRATLLAESRVDA